MRLSCADYTFPALPHEAVLDLISAIGFDGVDIGLFGGRTHIRPEQVRGRVEYWAGVLRERCESRRLVIADLFIQPNTHVDCSVNHPEEEQSVRAWEFFEMCLALASALQLGGMTMLPGVHFPGEDPRESRARAAKELTRRVDRAAAEGLEVSVEPHQGSVVETPAECAELLEQAPGLKLTLDYSHFVFAGIEPEEVHCLLPHARHVQFRGARPGIMQAPVAASVIDVDSVVDRLESLGYRDFLGTEYVWMTKWRCNEVDNLTETVTMFKALSRALGRAAPRVR